MSERRRGRMRLGIYVGSELGRDPAHWLAIAREADRLGYHSVWTSESYGADAVTPLAWILAHTSRLQGGTAVMQMPARTPATTAMTAATLDRMSEGRFMLGLGVSGPQVAEGWHGQPFDRPLARAREYVAIVRTVLAREAPLEHHGRCYDVPLVRPGRADHRAKPLKLMVRPRRPDVPIYLAALGPRNVELAAEIADGWLPLFFSPKESGPIWRQVLADGFQRSGLVDKSATFDVAAVASVLVGEDVPTLRGTLKPGVALYVGGMGTRDRNFYKDLVDRFGYPDAAAEVQDLFLGGHRREAAAAVPDALVDDIALVGPRARIRDRLAAWRDSGVTTLVLSRPSIEAVRLMAELVL